MAYSINSEGILASARYIESRHQNARPVGHKINMIVIHSVSLPEGEYGNGYVEKFFCHGSDVALGGLDIALHESLAKLKDLRVSAHLFITRTGEIVQFVPFGDRAWHAGASEFRSEKACNDFSIGIELEGTDYSPFEEIQYEKLIEVIIALQNTYPEITHDRIVGHEHIAPGRKTDPGVCFDWARLRNFTKEIA
ncbi:MAG TPA: 1,6-anhydro-N-acetylmuramyl-L-alanine amidase AmpD [Gammaproteobacteria bacterium]|jgi:AmpD protein|nr:1,6-anhydro-N-acetylmuramyl-L-alanine amidase AmpD [Gammaproteobacteria bacterium]